MWWNTHIKQARLDYFFISNTTIEVMHKSAIQPGYKTDHSISELTTLLIKFERGRGIWKFNASLLKIMIMYN